MRSKGTERAGALEVPDQLTWLTGKLKEDYLHDLQVVQDNMRNSTAR